MAMQQNLGLKPFFLFCSAFLFLIATAQKDEPASTPATAHASNTHSFIRLSGVVTDSLTGQPLPGSSIYLSEARLGAIADAQGHYQLPNIHTGHHLIEVSHTGYTTL